MKKFGKKSEKVLETLDVQAQLICREAIKITDIDFSLIYGYRSPEEQTRLFQLGRNDNGDIIDKSKVVTYKDGYLKKSRHNLWPSPAWDICAYIPGKRHLAYDSFHLCYLAGIFKTVAKQLKTPLVWGGNWDNDGEIYYDQNLKDLCHFQLK